MRRLEAGAIVVALLASAAAAQYDSLKCSTMWSSGTYNSACTTVAPCGHTCPPTVKSNGIAKPARDLSVDGWLACSKNGTGVYTTSIKTFNPVLLSPTAGEAIADKIHISDDGQWILYLNGDQQITIIRKDGTSKTSATGITASAACWYRSSPKGTEMAYLTNGGKDVMAAGVDFTSGKPVIGTPRTLGANLGTLNGSEFAVAKDVIFARVNNTMFGKNVNSGTLFTISDNGLGTATASGFYNSRWQYNCGLTLSHDGTRAASNANSQNAAQYTDCIMGGHWGVSVVPVKHVQDSLLSIQDWYLGTGSSINWAPMAWRTTTSLNLHNHNFTNSRDWLVDVDWNQGSALTPYRHGIQLLHIPSNTWYLIGRDSLAPAEQYTVPAVYLSSGVVSAIDGSLRPGVASVRPSGLSRTQGLDAWYTILGRRTGIRTGIAPGCLLRPSRGSPTKKIAP